MTTPREHQLIVAASNYARARRADESRPRRLGTPVAFGKLTLDARERFRQVLKFTPPDVIAALLVELAECDLAAEAAKLAPQRTET